MENSSEFILPGWKVKIAKRNKDWKQVIKFNQKLLDLTLENNFRDDLPAIHLDFARAYFNLNQLQKSPNIWKNLWRLSKKSDDLKIPIFRLALSETYHNAYRLLTQIKSENPQESFELADFLKARLSERQNQ